MVVIAVLVGVAVVGDSVEMFVVSAVSVAAENLHQCGNLVISGRFFALRPQQHLGTTPAIPGAI